MSNGQPLTTSTLAPVEGAIAPSSGVSRLPPIPWRDPHTVSPKQLAEVITSLKEACALSPTNADLRVCLGIAYAMNYDVYLSMDVLEEARTLEPLNFLAQFKYAELQYRLRALEVAEVETHKALELATTPWELEQARHQLTEIRRMRREGTIKPSWTKSLVIPMICFGLMIAVVTVLYRVIP